MNGFFPNLSKIWKILHTIGVSYRYLRSFPDFAHRQMSIEKIIKTGYLFESGSTGNQKSTDWACIGSKQTVVSSPEFYHRHWVQKITKKAAHDAKFDLQRERPFFPWAFQSQSPVRMPGIAKISWSASFALGLVVFRVYDWLQWGGCVSTRADAGADGKAWAESRACHWARCCLLKALEFAEAVLPNAESCASLQSAFWPKVVAD